MSLDPNFTDPFATGEGPRTLVVNGFHESRTHADTTYANAVTYLNGIRVDAAALLDIPDANVSLGAITNFVSKPTIPTAPTEPGGLTPSFPTAPAEPSLTGVAPLSVGDPPLFTAPDPVIDTILAPAAFSAAAPEKPALSSLALPTTPGYTLPTEPALLAISLPDVPLLSLPLFSAVLDAAPLTPVASFSFTETPYTTALLTTLNERLLTYVDGFSTGLLPAVEQAIWDRARAREAAVTARAREEAIRNFAARGFSMPGGALLELLARSDQEALDKSSSLSRDIAIKQAELEQTNFQFSFGQAIALEGQLLNHSNAVSQRAFEAARVTTQIAIDLFNAEVTLFNAKSQAYQVEATVYRERIQAEIARVEIYKAQIEGQRITGEINQQTVALYRERINAVLAIFELYKNQLEAVRIQQEGDKTRIEGYRAEVEAYDSLVKAKASEFDGYKTRVEGEGLKAEVHKSLAAAFNSKIEGYKALVQAKVAEKDSEIKVNQEIPLEKYKVQAQTFQSLVQAESERLRGLIGLFEGRVRVFSAQVDGETGRVNAEVQTLRAEVETKVATANVALENVKANIERLIESARILTGASQAGAQVSSQLAAAAMSAVNLSAGISEGMSTNRSQSQNIPSFEISN
jgi:hypothetical protein